MNTDLLLATYTYIEADAERFSSEFYSQLFIQSYDIYVLFCINQTDMMQQQKVLMSTLKSVLQLLKTDSYKAVETIKLLGSRHQFYGAKKEHYDVVIEVLLDTMKTFLKEAWTPEKEKAWIEALTTMKDMMLSTYQ